MKKIIAITLSVCIMVGVCACEGNTTSGFVPQKEYDKVVAERDELQAKLDEIESNGNSENIPESEEKANVSEDEDGSEMNVEVLAEYTLSDVIGWYMRH